MIIEQLVGEELGGTLSEVRERSELYEEVVFFKKDSPEWHRVLTSKLGPPLISEEGKLSDGNNPSITEVQKKIALKLADSLGGIREGQTLYFGKLEDSKVVVMIWPWQDDIHVTLKEVVLS